MGKEDDGKLLTINKYEQYNTVEELMDKGRPNDVYYTLLVLSSVIVAAGLIVNNPAIVIGGMMVTPLITPLLLLGLGFSVGDPRLIKRVGLFTGKSILVIIVSALILGFIFKVDETPSFFVLDNTLNGAVLYFLVAFAAGFSATFAWIRREMKETLPGIAVAVALVPPLALMGLGVSVFNIDVVQANFFVFLFNLFGVVVGSILVFSLLKFYKVEGKVEKEIDKQEKKEGEKEEEEETEEEPEDEDEENDKKKKSTSKKKKNKKKS